MMFLHGQSVTRLRRRMVTDPYSGLPTLADWSDPDRLTLTGVAIAPSSSTEDRSTDGNRVVRLMSLYADTDVDVQAEDRIDDGTSVWECDGDPMRWRSPFTGWKAGSETPLRRSEPDGR